MMRTTMAAMANNGTAGGDGMNILETMMQQMLSKAVRDGVP